MSTSQTTMQETTTPLAPDEVLQRAKSFFPNRPSLYSAFLDMEGPAFCSFRGQGGEEIVIGVTPAPDGTGTRVTGSSYLFDMQVARFFTTLMPEGSL
jgi:hypothetical protein